MLPLKEIWLACKKYK